MTRGVSGILDRKDMAKLKGGSAEQRTAPSTMRRRESRPGGQRMLDVVEWRCLSRRDLRTVAGGSDEDEMVKVFEVS
jgi:hypothetical protein